MSLNQRSALVVACLVAWLVYCGVPAYLSTLFWHQILDVASTALLITAPVSRRR